MQTRIQVKRVVLPLLLLIALQTIGPSSAAAGGDLTIRRIRFNPPGADDGSRRSLNHEYILIRNDSDSAVRIKGWKIHDAHRDNVYVVQHNVRLRPGERLYLYTGRGTDLTRDEIHGGPTTHFWHWDKDDYVWDNDGDTATLRRRDGSVADRCGYERSDDSPHACI